MEMIRRRYVGSLRNFFDLYQPLADSWQVYDNTSGASVRLIAEGEGAELVRAHDASAWGEMKRRHHDAD